MSPTLREVLSAPPSDRQVAGLAALPRGFYERDAEAVALDLLGKLLVRELPDGRAVVRLSEVEAYLGVGDPAAHTFGGRRTARNEVMWGEGGHLYVYFTYGMHHCANVVTGPAGVPEAVLLRGGLPVYGNELIRKRRRTGTTDLDGPAKLCQGLAIDRADNGTDLTAGGVWLADDGVFVPPSVVRRLPRVGIAYAGEAATWPLRFCLSLDASAPSRRRARQNR